MKSLGLPDSYVMFATARVYSDSLRLVLQGAEREGRPASVFPAACLLIGFSIELYLKSWLSFANYPDRKLRKLGHDLVSAYTECLSEGFPTNPIIPNLIDIFGEGHQKGYFRYVVDGGYGLIFDGEHVHRGLSWVDSVVEQKLQIPGSGYLTDEKLAEAGYVDLDTLLTNLLQQKR